MLTPQTLDALPDELISLIDELQTEIIKSIAKKITKADYLTPSAEWQLYKAAQLRMSTKEITELLAKYTGRSKREIRRLYTKACYLAINEDAKIYRAYGKDASSFTRSVAFSNALKAGIANADGMMQNFTKSMVQSSRKTVTHLMDKAYLQVLSGAFSPQEAIYSAVAELAAKGIQSVTYPSGRTDWADVAIRRAVITGIGQTAGRMQLDLAAEMDCDLVEVTSHMGARPSHAEWQGKVYSISGNSKKYPKLSAATGYGTGAGLKGWNCRHDFYPFFEGISERASFPIDKAENAKEYELSQKQRAMERAIRKSKRGLAALNESINSTDDPELKAKLQSKFDRSSATLKQQERRMNEFCEANDLLVKNDRVRVVGFGKSVSQKAVHGSKRYVKKQGGGSGTSGGTAAKKSKAETESKDKIQTIDYTSGNTGKPELLKSAGVDKSGGSGIIEESRKMSAASQNPPDFSKYTVTEDISAVEEIKSKISDLLGIKSDDINLDGIKNTEVLEPFIKRLHKIVEDTKMKFPAISAAEIIDGDECCITSFKPYENKLYISSKFFNSKEALEDTLKEWTSSGILPKQAKSINYLAEHEAAHIRISDKLIQSDEAYKLFKNRKLSNKNDSNIYEYFADAVAIYRMNNNISDTNIIKAIEYLRKGGVKI
ncbi:MAG: phage minor capsid protein [Oscillospiraceae bacterium]